MLLIWCVGLSMLWRVTIHKPVITPLVPCNNIFSYSVKAMVLWLKIDSHPTSKNTPMDMRELCASPGKMWASIASSSNVDTSSRHTLVYYIICPFGCFILIGNVGCSAMSCGASTCN